MKSNRRLPALPPSTHFTYPDLSAPSSLAEPPGHLLPSSGWWVWLLPGPLWLVMVRSVDMGLFGLYGEGLGWDIVAEEPLG